MQYIIYACYRIVLRFYSPGLVGKTNWDMGMIDQYVDLVGDLFTEMIKSFFEKDEAKKVTITKNVILFARKPVSVVTDQGYALLSISLLLYLCPQL